MKVLCVGLMVCDIIAKPVEKKMLEKDHSKIRCIHIRNGGDAFNVACNLVSLGIENCLHSAVGRDTIGAVVLENARNAGVCTDQIVIEDRETSASLVMIQKDGERHFLSQNGASQFLTGKKIPDDLLEESDILYIGSACDLPGLDGENLHCLLERAKAHQMITVMDVTGNPGREELVKLKDSLPLIDFFMPSNYEAQNLTGTESEEAAAKALIALGVKTVVIKRGSKGSLMLTADNPESIEYFPAYKMDAVDSTGAGDAFVSGFLAAYCKKYPIGQCIEIASLTGADCVRTLGASGNLKNISYYEQMMTWRKIYEESDENGCYDGVTEYGNSNASRTAAKRG